MENALLIGLSRQSALARSLDAIANNVANLNTAGFKADDTIFHEYLAPRARNQDFAGADRRASFVLDRATYTDMRQGPARPTGNPLDVALDGPGFLAVQTPAGERYTRNGALKLNAAGELVTSEGHRVMGDGGPIVLQPQDRNITIAQDGTISVGTNAGNVPRGKLRLVEFAQPQRLRKDGTSLFAANDGLQPQPSPTTRVAQGSVEGANVHGVAQMTRLIEINRAYTMLAQWTEQQNAMRRTAIERLADVPA